MTTTDKRIRISITTPPTATAMIRIGTLSPLDLSSDDAVWIYDNISNSGYDIDLPVSASIQFKASPLILHVTAVPSSFTLSHTNLLILAPEDL